MNDVTHYGSWTFLTNHAHLLLCLAGSPDLRVREIADRIGITERATLRILHDLEAADYLRRERVGRRTHYRLQLDRPMRHPIEATRPVRVLVESLSDAWASDAPGPPVAATRRRP